jgi:tRNA threonylcarbamoyladenosine biosynthesis protein TsaB
MNILVIDTATEACSVAVKTANGIYSDFAICPQEHAVNILPMIQQVLKQAGLNKGDLDYLGFGRGPGSFTGVRIATGIIQGLALGLDKPVVGISTLASMANEAKIRFPTATKIVSAIDARMSEVYFAQYDIVDDCLHLCGEERVLPPSEALAELPTSAFHRVGTGWQAYPELEGEIAPEITLPNAQYMLDLAEQAIANGEAVAVGDIQPHYIRDKVTWKKLPGRE